MNNFAQKFTLNVYDGNIVLGGPFLTIGTQDGGMTGPLKDAELNFTNLNISLSGPMGSNDWFVVTSSATINNPNDKLAKFDVRMNDCVIDLTQLKKANQIFKLGDTNTDIDFEINGGELIAGQGDGSGLRPYATKLYTLANDNASISFGKGSDGKYLTLIAHTDINTFIKNGTPTILDYTVFYTDTGIRAEFINPVTNGDWVTYTLSPWMYIEGYGTLPHAYSDATKYPIVIFQGGEFKDAYGKTQFTDAMSAARGLVDSEDEAKTGKAQILLRGDAEATANDQNLGAAVGTIDVNLGGFTVTQTDSTQLFFARTKTYSANAQSFTLNVYGGEIVVKGWLLSLGTQSNAAYNQYKSANINFTDVKVTASNGLDHADFLAAYSDGGLPMTMPVYYNIAFNDCVFDVSGMLNTTNVFNFNSTSTAPVAATVKINGGEIILGSTTANSNIYTSNDKSNVTFGKGSDGQYLKITVPSNVTSATVNNKVTLDTGIECVFVKASVEGENTTYQVYPSVMVGYTIKSSISLYSDLIFNIYIPKNASIYAILINNETISQDVLNAGVTLIDAKEYYKISIPMAPNEAFKNIAVTVTLNSGKTTVNASWTLSVLEHAKKAINNPENTDVEKTLMNDMLAYVASVYEYAKCENAAEVRAAVNAVIGNNYTGAALPTDFEKVTELDGVGEASMHLSATPGFVFYPDANEDGSLVYDASLYVFTQGSRKLDFELRTDEKGKQYFEVYNYAYGMCENVDYKITGTEITGTYNIGSYYEFAKTLNSETLTAAVEWLWRYSMSAKAYRESVTKN